MEGLLFLVVCALIGLCYVKYIHKKDEEGE